MIYAKLSQQMLWHCHKNWFVRTILRIRLIQVYPKYREPDLKLCRILLEFSQWTEPVFMAMPKPLLTEFGIHHSLKSCTHDLKFSVVLQIFELNNKALITKTWHSLKYAPVSVFQESQIPFMRKCLASKQNRIQGELSTWIFPAEKSKIFVWSRVPVTLCLSYQTVEFF